jgi:predicted nucleic acid-binding protein
MHIVSNTSPVSNLAIVGRLDLLRAKFGRVTIPSAVAFELSRLSHPGGAAAVQSALAAGWLVIASVPDRALLPVLRARVDEDEAEAIELARQTHADLLIIDNAALRVNAQEEGLSYVGIIGLLAEEREAGRISSLKAELVRLRAECRFFIAPALEERVLRRVGEIA